MSASVSVSCLAARSACEGSRGKEALDACSSHPHVSRCRREPASWEGQPWLPLRQLHSVHGPRPPQSPGFGFSS